jgi:DNA-binding CsgD family transcriptional regulator
MSSESDFTRMSNKVTAYLDRYVTLAGIEMKEEMTELFDKIHLMFPNWVIMTCPAMHPDIHYISKNSALIFGTPLEKSQLNKNLSAYFSAVHDADKEKLNECLHYMHDLLAAIPPVEHHNYRTAIHYRFRKSNGQYIYLQDEKASLNLGKSGNLYFAIMKDVTAEKKFGGVKIEVFKQEEILEKVDEFFPMREQTKLTRRESDLVNLIQQGLTTKEIAWYLNISHHTVRNIKSKLFEKYRVSNTVELLNMTV